MLISVSQNIIRATHEQPGALIGVGQVCQRDPRGRVLKEGMVVIMLKDEKGTEVRVMLNPDEATVFGMSTLGAAMRSADQLPPDIIVAPPAGGQSPSGLVVT